MLKYLQSNRHPRFLVRISWLTVHYMHHANHAQCVLVQFTGQVLKLYSSQPIAGMLKLQGEFAKLASDASEIAIGFGGNTVLASALMISPDSAALAENYVG